MSCTIADGFVLPSSRTTRQISLSFEPSVTEARGSDRAVSLLSKSSRIPPRLSFTTQLQGVPTWVEVGVGLTAAFGAWLYIDGADDRARSSIREEENARYEAYQATKAQKAYVEPKDYWTLDELAEYNGFPHVHKKTDADDNNDEYALDYEGPILLAADGLVFNVWKGRNFYGPGGEYHIFAGRDATRLLAKTIVREETADEASKPLNIGERASLAAWMFTLKNKYDIVGKLKDFDPSSTAMY
ncbi:unnamed protein product [Cylindrotheca closterium]|uniref:Cytochrome b5 heme-binding domain-containing protein n=1 Tax=Cylindrotheca closterium TaxID=2856 RepID=A0AAD2CMR4_9STRA|nr:unnamed protein product [Cylindrotheca closterium]